MKTLSVITLSGNVKQSRMKTLSVITLTRNVKKADENVISDHIKWKC
jgi:hypothetical protein